jgi:hypothetical protein
MVYVVVICLAWKFYRTEDRQGDESERQTNLKYRLLLAPVLRWALRGGLSVVSLMFMHSAIPLPNPERFLPFRAGGA